MRADRKAFALERQCPACRRKAALQKIIISERHVVFVCRWCGAEYEPGMGKTN
jgi:nitrite reductase/ring-hydroxylating ferredoxin subunit